MKKRLLKLVAVLLVLAPMAFVAACGQPNDSATGGNPPDIVEENPSEENPSEENPPEEPPSEENPPEENPPEEEKPSEEQKPTKPSLPGGLVDGGNFQGNV